MKPSNSLSELVVRRPIFHAVEKMLREKITDDETRFRVAGNMLFYVEKNPRLDPQQQLAFRAELEEQLGKAKSERLFTTAQAVYKGYQLMLYFLRIMWLVLFMLGVWIVGRHFVGWGWNSFASLLAASFVSAATIELGKWVIILYLVWRRP